MQVTISAETPSAGEALQLYASVGCSAYTDDPVTLRRALNGSARVVTARLDGRLTGLARVVNDGASIAYLQDVLVHPSAQRAFYGSLGYSEIRDRPSGLLAFVHLRT